MQYLNTIAFEPVENQIFAMDPSPDPRFFMSRNKRETHRVIRQIKASLFDLHCKAYGTSDIVFSNEFSDVP